MANVCKGSGCEYYRVYYVPQQYIGGWLPNFQLPPDQRCHHPSYVIRKGAFLEGTNILQLKKCPLNEK